MNILVDGALPRTLLKECMFTPAHFELYSLHE